MQGHFTGASLPGRNCEWPSHDGEKFLFVARPSAVSFSPATSAGMVASFRVSLGGKKVRATDRARILENILETKGGWI